MSDDPQTPQPPMAEDKVVQVGKYKITILRSVCIGAASCVAVSPNVFKLDDQGKATVIEGGDDTAENVLMAAQACPTKAFVIVDTETGQQVWPN